MTSSAVYRINEEDGIEYVGPASEYSLDYNFSAMGIEFHKNGMHVLSNNDLWCRVCGGTKSAEGAWTCQATCDECDEWIKDRIRNPKTIREVSEETTLLTFVHVPFNYDSFFTAAVFLCDERCSFITPNDSYSDHMPSIFYDAANELRQRCADYVESPPIESEVRNDHLPDSHPWKHLKTLEEWQKFWLDLLCEESVQEYENCVTDRNYEGGDHELRMIADIYNVHIVLFTVDYCDHYDGELSDFPIVHYFGSDKCPTVYMVQYETPNGRGYAALCPIDSGCRFPPLSTTDTLVRRKRHIYALLMATTPACKDSATKKHFFMCCQLRYTREIMQREKEREERHELKLRDQQRRKEREIEKAKHSPKQIDKKLHVPDPELEIQIDLIRREAQEKIEREQERIKALYAEISMKQQVQKDKELEEQREAFAVRKLKQLEAEKLASDEKQRLAESKYVKDQIAIANAKEERCRKKQERKLSKKKLSVWELQEQEKQRAEEEQLANEKFAAELASKLKLR